MMKMTVKCDGPNQMMARMAQPTDGNEFRNGLIRSCTMTSVTGSQCGRKASTEPMMTLSSTANMSRTELVST